MADRTSPTGPTPVLPADSSGSTRRPLQEKCSFCGSVTDHTRGFFSGLAGAVICLPCVDRCRGALPAPSAPRVRWEETAAAAAVKAPLRPDVDAKSRRRKEALYDPQSIAGIDLEQDIGYPGQAPFTRGIHPTMFRSRFWTMRQYAGFSSPEESNRRYRYLLEQGQTGLSVAFDLPTQLGMDSDEELARGEVGKVGVPISTLDDFARVFEGIPLDRVSVSMTINATAIVLLSMFVAVGRRQGVPAAKLSGTVQNDILKEYIARGTYIFPPRPSLRLVTDIFEHCAKAMPRFNTISISGYHIREAGSTAAEELAFTFANACTYVRAAIDRGLDREVFVKALSFFFNGHSDFLEEVAKYRAARRIWYRLLRDRFGVRSEEGLRLRFHTQTAGSTLTAQEPANNVTRVALQALAAVLGGTQSLHTNAMDEALGLPTEDTARTALRTQQIIAHESGVADVVDPLGGAWAIERLTTDLETEAMELLGAIEKQGGMLAAIETGFVQARIQDSAFEYQREVEDGKRIVVGVNAYQTGKSSSLKTTSHDPATERGRIEALKAWKAARPDGRRGIDAVEAAARGSENLVEPIIAALEAGSTLGEIAHALRGVFGEHQDPTSL